MKNWIELYKLIRRFGVKLVVNAASDLKPRNYESVGEWNKRRTEMHKKMV